MNAHDHASIDHALAMRQGRGLEYVTLGWNVTEALVAIGAGVVAGSTALVGFGIDSVIESLSGIVLLWRLADGPGGARRERLALKLVGASFLALAAYVAYESAEALILQDPPDASYVGIVLAVISAVLMPVVARAKRHIARRLDSRAMQADSRQSSLCGWLSVILLVGLVANALWGWWWADPVAGLAMVAIIAQEGVEALRGNACGCQDSCGGATP
jgi:divalent metal cation (Fe/Co/Zn/Cd) transporter